MSPVITPFLASTFSLPNMISIQAVRRKKTEIDFLVIDEAKGDVLIQLMRLDGENKTKEGNNKKSRFHLQDVWVRERKKNIQAKRVFQKRAPVGPHSSQNRAPLTDLMLDSPFLYIRVSL